MARLVEEKHPKSKGREGKCEGGGGNPGGGREGGGGGGEGGRGGGGGRCHCGAMIKCGNASNAMQQPLNIEIGVAAVVFKMHKNTHTLSYFCN